MFWNLLIGLFYLVDAGVVFGLSLLFIFSTRTRRSR